ncbi:phospholipase D-like domain-containing protein [Microlunatus soli]|uniref:Cardiolipin synthetase 2 n=1 Tax=Microlunatus soli TaxID=630515 RepID=A0A1H1WEH8_9ACTN|nr:phospholipase D-like domain-containing protein [Microlunatus soli]SDS94559.1 cardiolipin synthetase 2 [Microlunatus soli]
MTPQSIISTVLLVVDYAVKLIAIGTVPENRRPSSGQAWLLLILFLPIVGLPLFFLIGSPYVHGRRHRLQAEANRAIKEYTAAHPLVPATVRSTATSATLVTLNRQLTSMPCVVGFTEDLHPDARASIASIAAAVDRAERYVHLEIYALGLDEVTEPLFAAMARAVERGVTVRVLYDQLGSSKYSRHQEMNRRMTAAGIDWHRMMPINLLKGKWRRPDLRNHRKLVVIDGERAFMGSQNLIEPGYHNKRNHRIGREWIDLNVEVSGEIVQSLDVIFATDWYAESDDLLVSTATGEVRDVDGRPAAIESGPEVATDAHPEQYHPEYRDHRTPDREPTVFQLVPSGPGFPTEPNLRLFTSMLYLAQRSVSIVSPYFVPDESLLAAITTAAYRGVVVELFVSEKADQFMVHHAQRSYYQGLLEAGVRIYLYPAPYVLHTKAMTVDDQVGVIGSSNMDMRSFALDYEIMLLGMGADFTAGLNRVIGDYRDRSTELDLAAWTRRPWHQRYLDNALRLTSALQ